MLSLVPRKLSSRIPLKVCTQSYSLMLGGLPERTIKLMSWIYTVVKIRLQMQGEMAKATGVKPVGAVHIIRQLGLLGLYKGASACLLRDVPFSAIYFTGYAHLKKDVFREGENGKKLSFFETLTAAGIAGMPAAYLTTPADVIKVCEESKSQVYARPVMLMFITPVLRRDCKAKPKLVIRLTPAT